MGSPNIGFAHIPSSIRKPGKYFEFNTALAVRTLPANVQKVLLIGQRLTSGSVAANVLTNIFSDKEAETYFGAGSMLHLMARAAINANAYLQLTAIAVDDAAGGVAATGTITIGGPATASGALTLYVGGKAINIAIASGDSADTIAAALNTELGLNPDLPVTATVLNAVVSLTAKNKGPCGNDIGMGYLFTNAAGVTCSIVAMANGATNPTLTTALAAAYAEQYDIYITPYNTQTDLGTLKTQVDGVSGPMEQRPAMCVYGFNGSLANCTTLSGQINHGRTVCAYLRYTAATLRKSMPYEIASAFGAVMASEEDPAMPLNTLALPGIAPAAINDRFSRTEQENLLLNGVTPIEIGPGETPQIVRAITTYIKDANNIPDISFLDATTPRSLDYGRKAIRERISLRFPRSKLSSKTPPKVRTEILDVMYKLEELEIWENVDQWKAALIVEKDSQDPNRLNAKIPADVVNGLHVFAGRIDLIL